MEAQKALIAQLAQMMVGKQAESEFISEGFALLCRGFDFDNAVLYEADHYNLLRVLEEYGAQPPCRNLQIELELLLPDVQERLKSNRIIYCDVNDNPTPGQAQLLEMLDAKSAAVASVVNKSGEVYGMIALCNITEKEKWNDETRQNLEAALFMLAGHVTIRLFQHRLTFSQSALETVFDNAGIDIYVNDFHSHEILYVNKSMAAPYGGQAKFVKRKCWEVLFPGQAGPCVFCPQEKLIDDAGNPTKVYTWDYQRAFDGSWFRVFSAAFRWVDNRMVHVVSSADITDNKRNEALIEYLANYDSLTKLPNRRMLVSACQETINKGSSSKAYLLFFDIDGFKNVNDDLGHDAGDEFLVKLGQFFSGIPMLHNSIYRNGGDEFVALLCGAISENNVRDLARFIQARFQKMWDLKNGSVKCGVSIGVAIYPDDGANAEELLRKADQAMYRVKKDGGGDIRFFG